MSAAADTRAAADRAAADRAAVRALVGLKLRLLRNGLRRSRGMAVGYVVGVCAGLLVGLSGALGLAALHGRAGAADAAAVLVAGLTVCWAAMPLFFFASDESADPTRLTMLPLRPAALLRGSLLGGLIGPGPLANALLLTGGAVAAGRGAASAAVAVLAVPLVLLVLVALIRAIGAANARMLSSRRGKDLAVFGGLLFALLAQAGNLGLQSSLNGSRPGVDLSVLHPYASVVRWIPPVAALDAVRSAGEGAYLLAAGQLLLTAAVLAGLLAWWLRGLRELMVSGDSSTLLESSPAATARAEGWWRLLPAGRVGAVAQRQLRYAWREPRAKAAVFTGIGMTAVFAVLSAVQGWGSVYVVAIGGLMLGLQSGNLFGGDGSGFWMVGATLATRRDARDELRGRVLAVALYAVPVLLLFGPPAAALNGDWGDLAPALGLALAALGTSLGVGSLLSVLAPFALPADGNPMRNAAPGQNGAVMLNAFGSLVGVTLLCLPVGGLLAFLLLGHHPSWPLLPVGVLYGTALALLGVRIASGRLIGRVPEVLAKVTER
ncbi:MULTISPECIES: hypothetical protein [Kitasatospora]|uniref:Transporter n=1 Tax=Kitasatospora setae (strain ATCC 33774 / DSM 43861 / JCM 3304 / KCC A-0304 / NBRC 14216 / KM-6054) TaxID=452652 RepID=E4NCR7_KITSK|nr:MULTISPECIES: hypothetical protein [Kitasatospora]BAJ28998.1 hypothetical protein KSE_31880 [Kitasatospora setae KM-6054]